ncbi:MAG: helix-turn-helix transcriptional regulator [Clostridia bacterium]|nr:helix-turn-helix transcriptional regulator [Clostridia bacterium]
MFGERLRQAREAAGMSQEEVARVLGVSQAAYSYFENGEKNPSLPAAKRLAVVLHTSLDYLVGIEKKNTK